MWTNYAQTLGNFAVTFVTGFATFLSKALIVITLSVLFSVEKISVMKFISSLGGEKKYKYIYIKLEKIYKQLGIWLKSRLLLSLFMATTLYVSLWILELFGMSIPNKLSLALIL
jgi:predicted PurR-regulated permease PerM